MTSASSRLDGLPLPHAVEAILGDARAAAEQGRRAALWEAEMARRALAPLGCPVVLLKGTAYAAAGLLAGQGRSIGDLDILVPRAALDRVEAAVLGGLGGLIGSGVGVLAVVLTALLRDWTPVLAPWVVVAAPMLGLVSGLVAGVFPALCAARVQPADALRR